MRCNSKIVCLGWHNLGKEIRIDLFSNRSSTMADLNFDCPHCGQNLTTDESISGEQIDCPKCSKPFEIPKPGEQNVTVIEYPPPKEEPKSDAKKYSVPVHEGKPEVLVKSKAVEEELMSGDGRICVKTIKRGECIELGHDKFDDVLNEFLAKLNRDQIISIQSVNYAHFDPSTQKYLNDYGAMIVYQR